MGQFADDLWTTSPAHQKSLNATLQELTEFARFSGLTINAEKTAVLRIGPWKNSEAKFYTLKKLFWSPDFVKNLGIIISPHEPRLIEENYGKLLNKVNRVITQWLFRDLDVMSKITIINLLINTLYIHKFLALPSPPASFFQEYYQKIKHYFWGNKPAKFAYVKLIQDYSKLGLRLVDLQSKDLALKAAIPIRIGKENFDEYKWFYASLPIKDE